MLCVFGQAVAAVPERRVVIVIAYSRVERYALYDRLRVETFKFGVGIEFVEIGDPQREIGVGEKFNRLRLGKRGIQYGYILFYRAAFKQTRERLGGVSQFFVTLRATHYYTAGIKVIVKSMPFAQKLGAEQNVFARIFFSDAFGIPYGNG